MMICHSNILIFATAGYFAVSAIAAFWVFSRLADPKVYRAFFSAIFGLFWPLPAAVFIFICIEGWMVDVLNWFRKR